MKRRDSSKFIQLKRVVSLTLAFGVICLSQAYALDFDIEAYGYIQSAANWKPGTGNFLGIGFIVALGFASVLVGAKYLTVGVYSSFFARKLRARVYGVYKIDDSGIWRKRRYDRFNVFFSVEENGRRKLMRSWGSMFCLGDLKVGDEVDIYPVHKSKCLAVYRGHYNLVVLGFLLILMGFLMWSLVLWPFFRSQTLLLIVSLIIAGLCSFYWFQFPPNPVLPQVGDIARQSNTQLKDLYTNSRSPRNGNIVYYNILAIGLLLMAILPLWDRTIMYLLSERDKGQVESHFFETRRRGMTLVKERIVSSTSDGEIRFRDNFPFGFLPSTIGEKVDVLYLPKDRRKLLSRFSGRVVQVYRGILMHYAASGILLLMSMLLVTGNPRRIGA